MTLNLSADSSKNYFVVKMEPRSARGVCLPEIREVDSSEVLKRNNVRYFGFNSDQYRKDHPNSKDNYHLGKKTQDHNNTKYHRELSASEKEALAKVIYTVESLGDGSFEYHKGAHYRFGNIWGPSRFDGRYIQINPGGQNMKALDNKSQGGRDNHGVIAHELGHFIGHKGLYTEYRREVGGGCHVSKYSKKRFNEEFADVFAAYVTNPDLLKNKGPYCDLAIKFFDKKFGVDKGQVANNCIARKEMNSNVVTTELKTNSGERKKQRGIN